MSETSLVLAVLMLQPFVFRRLFLDERITRVLALGLSIFWTLWLGLPILNNLFLWDLYPKLYARDDYIRIALIELTAFLGATSLFYLISRLIPREPLTRTRDSNLAAAGRPFLYLISLTIIVTDVFSFISGEGYLERNLISSSGHGTSSPLILLKPVLLAFIYAHVIFSERGVKAYKSTSTAFCWLAVFFDVFHDVVFGGRFTLLTPFVLWLFHKSLFKSSRRPFRFTKVIGGIAALPFLAIFGVNVIVNMAEYRETESGSLSSVFRVNYEDTAKLLPLFLLHLNIKLDMTYYSGSLYVMQDAPQAPWNTFAGAALAFVPRFFYPEKPITGSLTGDEHGLPYRMAAQTIGMPEYGNVSLSPAVVTAWEFGLWAVPAFSVLMSLYFLGINWSLRHRSFYLRFLGIYALSIPTFITLYTAPETALVMVQRMAIVFFLFSLLRAAGTFHASAGKGTPIKAT